MAFKDVKLKSIDQKSPYVYPTRRVELITSEKRILTPNRAATLYEYNQKSAIPTDIPLDNEISLSIKKLNKNKLTKFLKGNGLYANWSRDLVDAEDRMKYSPFSAHIIQPTITNYKIKKDDGTVEEVESGVEFLRKNSKERERFLRLIIKMQTDAGASIVTIPYLNLPLSDYQELVKSTSKLLHADNREPMFVFDLDYQKRGDKFEDAMKFLIEKSKVKLIAFPNRSFQSCAVSYDILSDYAENDIAFVSFDAERAYRTDSTISKMHSYPFIGTDIYTVKTPRFFPKNDEKEKVDYQKTKDSIKFFNPTNLLIQPSQERIKNVDTLLDEIDQSDNKWLKNILGDYDTINTEQDKLNVIDSVSKVHELKSSTSEFSKVRKRIKSDESTEYVKEKTYLSSTLDTLKKKKRKKS